MRATLALLVILVAVPVVVAEDLQAELDVQGKAAFIGTSNGQVAWTGAIQDARLGSARANSFEAKGNATLFTYTYALSTTAASSPVGYTKNDEFLNSTNRDLGSVSGEFLVVATSDNASTRLLPNESRPVRLNGNFSFYPGHDLHEELFYGGDAQPYDVGKGFYPVMGAELACPSTVPMNGFLGRLIVTGQLFTIGDSAFETRWKDDGIPLPTGGFFGVRTTYVLEVDGWISAPSGLDCATWTNTASHFDADLAGDLWLAGADGRGTLGGAPLPAGVHLFQAKGAMSVHADFAGPTGHWTVEGSPDYVAVNAASVLAPVSTLATVATVGLLATAAAAAARWAWAGGVPGLNIAEPLSNPKRLRILAAVSSQPGIDQSDLAHQVAAGRSTVRHHVSILTRADLITERRIQGRLTYTLNDGSFEFTPLPGETVTAGQVTGLLRQKHRHALLDALTKEGESDYEGLRAQLATRGILLAPDAASYHLGILRAKGLVSRRVFDGRALWSARIAHDKLTRTSRERFLALGGLKAVFDALEDKGQTSREIFEGLRARGWKGHIAEVTGKLDLLVATGYARQIAAGRFVPTHH